jgi:hypothetical protein
MNEDRQNMILPIAIVGLMVAQHTFSKNFSTHWQGGWAVIAMFATIMVSIAMWRRGLWAFVPIFVVMVLSGLAVGMAGMGFPTAGFTEWPVGAMSNISIHVSARMFSMISVASVISLIALGLTISKTTAEYLAEALAIAGAFTGLTIIYEGLILKHPVHLQVWVMDNPGCAATFSIFGTLWLLAHSRSSREITTRDRTLLTAAIVLAVGVLLFIVKSSTPIMAAAAGLLFIVSLERPKIAGMLLALGTIVAILVGRSKGYSLEADASGRMEIWRAADTYWRADPVRMLLGNGLGTTTIVLPLLTAEGWYTLHSDFVQILFELGILGLLTVSVAILRTVWGVRENRAMMAVACAFLISMTTNFTGHISINALWILAFVRMSI